MKKIKLMLALCILTGATQAQFTGQSSYDHSGLPALLSSGSYVSTNPGFIMTGYTPVVTAGQFNLFVDKVNVDGSFTGAGAFSTGYTFADGGYACAATPTIETNCYGASIVERPSGSPVLYALAATFKSGVVFATLDNTGNIINNSFYSFPAEVVPNCKPIITLSAAGGYYICGSYAFNSIDYMYVLKVNNAGGNIWSTIIGFNATNTIFTPRAAVEDSYPGFPELAIAGIIAGSTTTDGFLMTFNGATGAQILQKALASGQVVNESTSSLALTAAGGYLLGGSTYMTPVGGGHAWMLNLTVSGTLNWSSRINPSTSTTAGEVIGVGERFSSVYGAYENYGLTVSSGATGGGMLVVKLDATGNAFSKVGNTNNEFVYNDFTGNIATAAAFSFRNAGSNTGIHLFGTNNTAPDQFFLNQACFNGATGSCPSTNQQNLTVMTGVTTGPSVIYNFTDVVSAGLTQCKNFRLIPHPLSYTPSQPCSMSTLPTSPYIGSNNRTMQPTGIALNSADKTSALSVYPNPSSGATDISYAPEQGGNVKISLTNILGQQVKVLDSGYKEAGVNNLHVDLNSFNLQSGVYFISLSMNGEIYQQKLVFTGN